ncbi:metal-dependent hydrolase [Paenibacillus selenitireducens]|jgi:L-ascorbate metabolism protein UlaG (beta-lactamase superfamily)|uniref:UPF0173 metal-dependent hydrolase BVG16_01790 n=1 Tax=Paenibacillus selenitireducens TaxID=1324314 RepID=A0A1T2XMQ6_9BACL|nr:metal-dependent hydrolase [Paenibacillus selenitireducens]OPA81095.1 metal-dependent hydrolase [Paenibacillus selenitireducens]
MELQFIGHSCFIVSSDHYKVIIDPFIHGNPLANVDVCDIQVDAVLLTHGHSDHTADALEIALQNDCPIIANFEICQYFGSQGAKVFAMNTGGSHTFPFGTVKFTQAMHSSSLETDNGVIYGGLAGGILLTMNGKTFYHAGDTALFSDLKLIGEHRIDVAAVPIGDVFTMGPQEALLAAEWIGAKAVIPVHYDTFPAIEQDAKAWVMEATNEGLHGIFLRPSASYVVE